MNLSRVGMSCHLHAAVAKKSSLLKIDAPSSMDIFVNRVRLVFSILYFFGKTEIKNQKTSEKSVFFSCSHYPFFIAIITAGPALLSAPQRLETSIELSSHTKSSCSLNNFCTSCNCHGVGSAK